MEFGMLSNQEASFLSKNNRGFEEENETFENETCRKLASLFELTNRRPLTEKPN
jgi:hypothetical protein